MVSLHYTITKKDYINFYTYVMWDAGDKRRKRAKDILKQFGFVALFIIVFYTVGGFRYLTKTSIIIILAMFGTSFLPILGGRSNAEKEAEEIADDPDNAGVFLPTIFTAAENGITVKTDIADIKYAWKAIVRKTETGNYFYLFPNAMQALIVPKNAFATAQDLAAFQKLLSMNLSLEADLKEDIINAGE